MIPIEEVPPAPQGDPNRVERRLLTPEEVLEFVKPIYDKGGYPLPNPASCVFVGIIRGGKVKAFLGLQVMLHAEPLWIEDGEASLLTGLVEKAEEIILERTGPQWVYLFAPPGKVARIAERLGMQMEPLCVYSKLVMPPSPPKPLSSLDTREEEYEGIVQ